MNTKILFISPLRRHAMELARTLEAIRINLVHAYSLRHANSRLGHEEFAAILTEAKLPDGCWRDVLHLRGRLAYSSEVIVTDAFADSRFWAEALSLGAYDVLAQPFATFEVQRIVSNACTRQVRAFPAGAA